MNQYFPTVYGGLKGNAKLEFNISDQGLIRTLNCFPAKLCYTSSDFSFFKYFKAA